MLPACTTFSRLLGTLLLHERARVPPPLRFGEFLGNFRKIRSDNRGSRFLLPKSSRVLEMVAWFH